MEFLPEESEINYDYLYQIKEMAKKQGFKYYAKVPWIKGDFKANTGRKSKNSEDIMIFSKGEARALKLDNKKNIATAKKQGIDVKGKSSYEIRDLLEEQGLIVSFMKGTNGMLPTQFNYTPKPIKEKINEAEKPIELLEEIINYITKPYEYILDQFAGSGNLGIASLNTNRNAILIEKDEAMYKKMKKNVEVGRRTINADRNFIRNLIDVGALDDVNELKTKEEYESAVDYWVEHYFDDYSDNEIKEEISNEDSVIVYEKTENEEEVI